MSVRISYTEGVHNFNKVVHARFMPQIVLPIGVVVAFPARNVGKKIGQNLLSVLIRQDICVLLLEPNKLFFVVNVEFFLGRITCTLRGFARTPSHAFTWRSDYIFTRICGAYRCGRLPLLVVEPSAVRGLVADCQIPTILKPSRSRLFHRHVVVGGTLRVSSSSICCFPVVADRGD